MPMSISNKTHLGASVERYRDRDRDGDRMRGRETEKGSR